MPGRVLFRMCLAVLCALMMASSSAVAAPTPQAQLDQAGQNLINNIWNKPGEAHGKTLSDIDLGKELDRCNTKIEEAKRDIKRLGDKAPQGADANGVAKWMYDRNKAQRKLDKYTRRKELIANVREAQAQVGGETTAPGTFSPGLMGAITATVSAVPAPTMSATDLGVSLCGCSSTGGPGSLWTSVSVEYRDAWYDFGDEGPFVVGENSGSYGWQDNIYLVNADGRLQTDTAWLDVGWNPTPWLCVYGGVGVSNTRLEVDGTTNVDVRDWYGTDHDYNTDTLAQPGGDSDRTHNMPAFRAGANVRLWQSQGGRWSCQWRGTYTYRRIGDYVIKAGTNSSYYSTGYTSWRFSDGRVHTVQSSVILCYTVGPCSFYAGPQVSASRLAFGETTHVQYYPVSGQAYRTRSSNDVEARQDGNFSAVAGAAMRLTKGGTKLKVEATGGAVTGVMVALSIPIGGGR